MDAAIEEGAGGEHHGAAAEAQADLRDGAGDAAALEPEVVHRLLEQPKVGLILQAAPDGRLVEDAVGLGPRGAHGGPLGCVEDPELDARLVGGGRHGTAERVDLLDQVPLADAADGRIAAHLAQRLDVVREQQRGAAHARAGQRRLGAGVAATDHDHVELLRVLQEKAPGEAEF